MSQRQEVLVYNSVFISEHHLGSHILTGWSYVCPPVLTGHILHLHFLSQTVVPRYCVQLNTCQVPLKLAVLCWQGGAIPPPLRTYKVAWVGRESSWGNPRNFSEQNLQCRVFCLRCYVPRLNKWAAKVHLVLTESSSPHIPLGQNQTKPHTHLRGKRVGGDMKSECTAEVHLTQYQLVFG